MTNGDLAPHEQIQETWLMTRYMTRRTTCGLLAAAMLVSGTRGGPLAAQETLPASPAPSSALSDLSDIEQFRDLFNNQAGKPRLILLIAPT